MLRGVTTPRVRGPICFIGDVHGCTDKLKRLWDKLPGVVGGMEAFEKLNIVFLGDYCDKGPDTRGTLDFVSSLEQNFPEQNHFFLAGNHDFAFSCFLGLLGQHSQLDLSPTWRQKYASRVKGEKLYDGPGYEKMHLQGLRYATSSRSIFNSESTFESYGVPYGDRVALLEAIPEEHKKFFNNLQWILEMKSNVGDIIAVHAGLENDSDKIATQIESLRNRESHYLMKPFIEPLCGRANVERMPQQLMAPVLKKRGVLPPPLFLISGHHGFIRIDGRRIILDSCAGRADKDMSALVLKREGNSKSHHALSNEQGLAIQVFSSRLSF